MHPATKMTITWTQSPRWRHLQSKDAISKGIAFKEFPHKLVGFSGFRRRTERRVNSLNKEDPLAPDAHDQTPAWPWVRSEATLYWSHNMFELTLSWKRALTTKEASQSFTFASVYCELIVYAPELRVFTSKMVLSPVWIIFNISVSNLPLK